MLFSSDLLLLFYSYGFSEYAPFF